jgi:hypothetical protein
LTDVACVNVRFPDAIFIASVSRSPVSHPNSGRSPSK